MNRLPAIYAVLLLYPLNPVAFGQSKVTNTSTKVPDGVYAVVRENQKKKNVLPLKKGESLIVHRHRYLKKVAKTPHRFLVVRSAPDVALDLASAPKADKKSGHVVRILLTLKPKAAKALEQLTRKRVGKQLAIVIGGEVVTAHQVRQTIRGGRVQITNCAAGAGDFLFRHLQALYKRK